MLYYQGLFENGMPKVVIQQDEITKPLPHLKHHSDAFAWGYAGSGPADLARSLLSHHIGVTPPKPVYQAFKGQVIAGLDQHAGWVLPVETVVAWCEEYFTHQGKCYQVMLRQVAGDWEADVAYEGDTLLEANAGIFTPVYGVAYTLLAQFSGWQAIPVTTVETFAAEGLFPLYEEAESEIHTRFPVTDVEMYRWFRTQAHRIHPNAVISTATSYP